MTQTVIGRYQILRELGRGGMATVYQAHDPRFDRDVAVKVLPREFLHDPTFRARFEREAKTIAALEHQSIVPVYDFGEQDGQPYLIMRYMPGGSLSDRMRQGSITLGQTNRILGQLSKALDFAHSKGIIHRDLKPDNILFDGSKNAYLSDFGIVKLIEGTSTFTGHAIIGTPAYMSPEQARGDRNIDSRSDLYTLGVILFQMLSGELPYDADTPIGFAMKHVNDPIPSIREVNPTLPEGIEKIIDKAMAKTRDDRFEDATTLSGAVDQWIEASMAVTMPALGTPEQALGSTEAIVEEAAPSEEIEPPVELDETLLVEEHPPAPEDDQAEKLEEEVEVVELADAATVMHRAGPLEADAPEEDEAGAAELEEEFEPEAAVEAEIAEAATPGFEGEKPRRRRFPVWMVAIPVVVALAVILGIVFVASGGLSAAAPPVEPTAVPTRAPTTAARPEEPESFGLPFMTVEAFPPVLAAQPSNKVAAVYYPHYRDDDFDKPWIGWQGERFEPPFDINSDYMPLLGPYNGLDPNVIAQHMDWLRQSGVGVIIASWHGPDTHSDVSMPLLFEIADVYGLKIAFMIRPYPGRTADRLIEDIQYLYDRYGDQPAFYRSVQSTRWSPDQREKGLFFIQESDIPEFEAEEVGPDYWRDAVDALHESEQGALIIANTLDVEWIEAGHFDGNYELHLDGRAPPDTYAWVAKLPLDSLYLPSVFPGLSGTRMRQDEEQFHPRREGATYRSSWERMLNASISVSREPDLVIINSFNDWGLGTQIEPALANAENGMGYQYLDFQPLPDAGYLEITREWANRLKQVEWPERYPAQIHLRTTSDWTRFVFLEGGTWPSPRFIHKDEEAEFEWLEEERAILLRQPEDVAAAGNEIELILEVAFEIPDPEGALVFEIERGHWGQTEVELFNMVGGEPVSVELFRWGGIVGGAKNARPFEIPAARLTSPPEN